MPKQVAFYAMAPKALIRQDNLFYDESSGILDPKRNKYFD